MKFILANDHRGYSLALKLMNELSKRNMELEHLGCYSEDSCDYPDYARLLGEKIASLTNGKGSDETKVLGIGICGSGVGIAMALNKVNGVRAIPVYNNHTAKYAKTHNDANVVTFSADQQSVEEVLELLDVFLENKFEGGRHQRRIDKIKQLEES